MILSAYNAAQMSTYKKEFSEEILYMEKEINKFSEKLVGIYLKDLFGNLLEFIQKYAKEETELELANLEKQVS
jgi:RAB protein geranylgeranyltransferase component A